MAANFKIKIGCTPQELKEAQRLRYEVFHLEIKGKQPSPSDNSIDQDEFDPFCEHLVVIDTDRNTVIGTYRMLLDTVAKESIGYYSATKFDLSSFDKLDGRMLEVGRSCVHKDYRHGYVLNLLWEGIAKYSMAHRVRYIFGSASLMTMDIPKINQFIAMFKALGLINDMGIRPCDPKNIIRFDPTVKVGDPKALFDRLPTLFKGYMHIGLKICGFPAKGDFNTAIFPILLDLKEVNKVYRKRFLGDYLLEKEPSTQPSTR